jgi:xanthine dehydrogenase accessory factor
MSRWLRPLRQHWVSAVLQHLEQGSSPLVRIVVAAVRGSAPREPGTCMLVSETRTLGTIGGGNLEWQALSAARTLLTADTSLACVRLSHLVLGRELGQCCGGVVQLWLERFTHADLPWLRSVAAALSADSPAILTTELFHNRVTHRLQEASMHTGIHFESAQADCASLSERIELAANPVYLYGAGHVGQALIRVMADLPFQITWIDSRPELLPENLPDNVRALCPQSATDEIPTAPRGTRHVVMTHDHALDYAICREVLAHDDFLWLGLIGSKSKSARFRSRLLREGVAPERIQRLVCPIGVPGVTSKWPTAIAVAIAAQLLQVTDSTSSVHQHAPRMQSLDTCSVEGCSECSATRGTRS